MKLTSKINTPKRTGMNAMNSMNYFLIVVHPTGIDIKSNFFIT